MTSSSHSCKYECCVLAHSCSLLSVTDEIEKLPLANTPEVLGLHSNAEIGYYTQAAKDMWTHLIDLQPQTGVFYPSGLLIYFLNEKS